MLGRPRHVAVAADAGHDPGQHPVGVVGVERAEAQRVHHGDRPGAHREDVADDAADAGRGALVGLDVRRVVVGLDLERDGVALADVDDAGVLADAGQHLADRGLLRDLGELLEVHLRALVGAVLAPHHGVHRELGAGRPAAEDLADLGVLVGLQPEVGPGLLALGVLGGDGDGVEMGDAGSGTPPIYRRRARARIARGGAATSGDRRRRPRASGVRRPASRSPWSATVAMPPDQAADLDGLDARRAAPRPRGAAR